MDPHFPLLANTPTNTHSLYKFIILEVLPG